MPVADGLVIFAKKRQDPEINAFLGVLTSDSPVILTSVFPAIKAQ